MDKTIYAWLQNKWDGSLDWDTHNLFKLQKHDVTSEEIEYLVENKFAFLGKIVEPERVSFGEHRYLLLGVVPNGRHFAIIFTIRNSKVRPISCRRMRKNEERAYQYEKKIRH